MQHAYYSSSIADFLTATPQSILGHLAEHHPHDLDPQQRNAWLGQAEILRGALRDAKEGWIALEFAIPRMGKRVDAIVICQGVVFVVEFKVGSESYDASAIDQVMDYALDR